ncbi:MAG: winged helix-turn-helix domain-containing protein [Thermoanaerobaculia bacterium]
MPSIQPAEIECVSDGPRARALLDPLRARILTLARQPVSATLLGSRLQLPRQRVNYHVRQLASVGLLKRAGRHRKRNMFEQRYVASAQGYVISPELLGEAGADWRVVSDARSLTYLLALSAQMQADVARASRGAGGQRKPLSALSLKSQFRFESLEQRERFTQELKGAVVAVIARFTAPNLTARGLPAPGQPFRLVLGCYPYSPTA